jgi:hypothetical protein
MDAFCRLTGRLCRFLWTSPFRDRAGECSYTRVPSAFVRYVCLDEMAQKAFEQRRAGKDESAFYMSPPQEILRELARRPIPVPQDTDSWAEIEELLAAWLVELEDRIFKNHIIAVAEEDEELDAEDDDLNPATTWKWRISGDLVTDSNSFAPLGALPQASFAPLGVPSRSSLTDTSINFNRPGYWFNASRGRQRIHFVLIQFPDTGTDHLDL